jgi:hypothetical protein
MAAIGVFSIPVTVEVVSVCHSPMLTGGVSESWAWAGAAVANWASESSSKHVPVFANGIVMVRISFAIRIVCTNA